MEPSLHGREKRKIERDEDIPFKQETLENLKTESDEITGKSK